ncbi:hypothetical protein Rsub_10962 [Raphidocelis subcapitata]|uniref:C3H1-type domain-containing protein n=1 Tax=Raphidocelis subcapitata TaxID=307507 RepID=A0A2V0PFJ4_9CHLO|nr:hypothetical protein Rsub_10962 [Raphidocelis subcapitata]|eukprot:GBF98299.1 hypothetical protein Rsub_10962 [Raphidocelis subcapitata]
MSKRGGDAGACPGTGCAEQPPGDGAAARSGDAMRQFAAGLYASDDFRINCYKVLPCPQRSSHAWSACPFAHPNERLRRRPLHREGQPGPLYRAELCPAVRARQECPMGSECGYAHNVFEHWLHPAMYRTRLCASGTACNRAVCFFAHSNDELRVVPPSSPPPAPPPLLAPPSPEASSRGAPSGPLPLVTVVSATDAAAAAAAAAAGDAQAASGGDGAATVTTGPTAWEATLAVLGLVPTEPLPSLAGELGADPAAALSALALDGAPLQSSLGAWQAAPLQAAPLSLAGQLPVAWDGAALLDRQLSLLGALPPLAVHEAPAQSLLLAGNPFLMGAVAAGAGAGVAPASVYGFAVPPPVAPQPAPQGAPLLLAAAPPQLQPRPLLLVPFGALAQEHSVVNRILMQAAQNLA